MDRRINYKIVLDTETCPLDKTVTDVNPKNMWCYDIAWIVTDKKGKVYKTRSFVNADIFLDEKELMNSAYYADKIPKYWEDIKKGSRTLTSFYNIYKSLLEDIAEYNVKEIYAHNMFFDYNALNTTMRWITKSKNRYFFPREIQICDTLKMARDVIGKMPSYKAFCEKNNYLTKNNRLSMTAETLYKFITNNNNFVESHTGLEDVLIEKEILAYCYRQHKKMRSTLFNN